MDHLDERIETTARRASTLQSVPRRKKTGEDGLVDRLNFAAQGSKRSASDLSKNLDVAPFALDTVRLELADHHSPVGFESAQRTDDSVVRSAESVGCLFGGEGRMRACEASEHGLQGSHDRVGEFARQAHRQSATECVAVQGRILGRDETRFSADRQFDDATGREQVRQRADGDPRFAAHLGLGTRQVADAPEHVVQFVRRTCPTTVGQALRSQFDRHDGIGIEQFTQLLRTEKIVQEFTIERQRGRTTFGKWRIAFVHVRGNPVEEQALRKRRCARSVDGNDLDATRPDARQNVAESRDVEDILETLATRLEQHGERRVFARNVQKVGCTLSLLP